MQTLTKSYRGMSMLMNLNWDRIITTGTVIVSLYAGAYIVLG